MTYLHNIEQSPNMVKCILAFLNFCYIAWHNVLTSADLEELQDALACFHCHQGVFVGMAGVNGDWISLPRQHSLVHYLCSIQLFGSLNGLCLSITESKHIKAAKEPWRCSSHYKALKQMLVTNMQLDKLALAGCVFSQLCFFSIWHDGRNSVLVYRYGFER
jgi:hypothetical protein